MSEYQYYEFQAIDRPLSERQRQELRACSTRATITSTRFVNHYECGDLKGDPRAWMERYFDAFLYVANWGTHWLMLRFPRHVLDLRTAKSYCRARSATATANGDFVILSFASEDESGDGWDDDGTGWLSSLIPLRADIAAGDYRALYLAWLLCVQEGEVGPHAPEPPIPPGFGKPTASLRAFADFMRIDCDLIAVASERSAEVRSGRQLDRWVAALPAETKSDLLVRFATGDSQAARVELLRGFRDGANHSPGVNPRKPAQLLAAAKQRTVERQRREAERAAAERLRKERAEAAARERYLVRLAKREAQTWRQVETLVATRKQSDYDEAVRLLKDLKELAARKGRAAEARRRIHCLRDEHGGKVTFVERLRKAGLLPARAPDDSRANGTKAARGSNFGSSFSRTPRS
jgi:hypothetical protein